MFILNSEVLEDGDELEETYDEWLNSAEETVKGFADQGITLTKVEVDVDELLAWSKERGLPINGESRSHYAAWLAQEKDKDPKDGVDVTL